MFKKIKRLFISKSIDFLIINHKSYYSKYSFFIQSNNKNILLFDNYDKRYNILKIEFEIRNLKNGLGLNEICLDSKIKRKILERILFEDGEKILIIKNTKNLHIANKDVQTIEITEINKYVLSFLKKFLTLY